MKHSQEDSAVPECQAGDLAVALVVTEEAMTSVVV